jgi:hypothetical protein
VKCSRTKTCIVTRPARTIDAAKKYVVSSTLDRVDWNAELVRGDLGKVVQQLKRESGKGVLMGGVKLPLALAELGLIDEYEFVVQPKLGARPKIDFFRTDASREAPMWGYPVQCVLANDGTAPMFGILGSILFPLSTFF